MGKLRVAGNKRAGLCSDGRFVHQMCAMGDVLELAPGGELATKAETRCEIAKANGWVGDRIGTTHYRCAAARLLGLSEHAVYLRGVEVMEAFRESGVEAAYIHFGEDGPKSPHSKQEYRSSAIVRQALVSAKQIWESGTIFRRDDHFVQQIKVANNFSGPAPEGVMRVSAPLLTELSLRILWQITEKMQPSLRPVLSVASGVSEEISMMIHEFGRNHPFYSKLTPVPAG